jgi:hypothetical protein
VREAKEGKAVLYLPRVLLEMGMNMNGNMTAEKYTLFLKSAHLGVKPH